VLIEVGTNNLPADASLASMQTDFTALLAAVRALTRDIIILPIHPRSTSMTAGRRLVMSGFNRWLYTNLASDGVRVVNTAITLSNPASATGDPVALRLEDGLHPAIPGSYAMSVPVTALLRSMFFFEDCPVISSAVDVFDATSNPLGNRLPSGGTFIGTGGTFNTGGSGTLGDGWRIERNGAASNITVVCSKVARTDGLPGDMQRLVFANAAAAREGAQLRLITPMSVSPGEVWQARASFVASSMVGVESIELVLQPNSAGGENLASCGGGVVATFFLTGALPKMTFETYPLTIPASGTTTLQFWLVVRTSAAGSTGATIDCLPGEFEMVKLS
jgi:hypothetical protein